LEKKTNEKKNNKRKNIDDEDYLNKKIKIENKNEDKSKEEFLLSEFNLNSNTDRISYENAFRNALSIFEKKFNEDFN